jgi:hypothetical protein
MINGVSALPGGGTRGVAWDMQTERRVVRALLLLLVALLSLGVVSVVHADPDPRNAARGYYERGLALAESHSYQAALAEFDRAYATSPHFAVLYNIGLCQVALGHPLEAVEALSKYLKEGGAEVPAERRTQVEAQLAELESRLAELSVTADRAGTLIAIDGREMGRTPLEKPLRLAAGAYEISATLDGAPGAQRRIELREGERRTIDFAFAATAPPLDVPPSAPSHLPPPLLGLDYPAPREAPEKAGARFRTVGYVLAGAGIAAGVGGVVHYAWNRGRHEDWETEQASLKADPPPADYHDRAAANNELADSIDGASAVTVGLFVASGALIAGGVALVVVDPNGGATVAWRGTW